MITHAEEIQNPRPFNGTIIDIETIGNFDKTFTDSRRYSKLIPVCFGIITAERLEINCIESLEQLDELKRKIIYSLYHDLQKPFTAFNSIFEQSVFFHTFNNITNDITIKKGFQRELNKNQFEAKKDAVIKLLIPNYDDPYNDDGKLVPEAWHHDDYKGVVAHNRSCLLKERDILLKRGYREPDKIELVRTE